MFCILPLILPKNHTMLRWLTSMMKSFYNLFPFCNNASGFVLLQDKDQPFIYRNDEVIIYFESFTHYAINFIRFLEINHVNTLSLIRSSPVLCVNLIVAKRKRNSLISSTLLLIFLSTNSRSCCIVHKQMRNFTNFAELNVVWLKCIENKSNSFLIWSHPP